jgi:Immunity protein 21
MTRKADTDWIQGDGGPAVVLQAAVVAQWQGAANFRNSVMNGGCVETDYDVICKFGDGVTAIDRYDRTMLILSDSECATRFMPAKNGEAILLQWFGSDSEPEALVDRLTASPPAMSLPFKMVDNSLRLLAGADDGNGGMYGFVEVGIPAGDKICEVYFSEEAQVIAIRPTEAAPA